MPKYLFLLIIVASLFSCQKNSVIIKEFKELEDSESGALYYKGMMKKFNGKVIEFSHDNKIKISEIDYVNGQKHGEEFEWYLNGEKRFSIYYTNGKQDGKHESWYQNGNKSYLGNYINGKRHGVHEKWYKSGKKEYIEKCNHGKHFGEQIYWYENGKIKTLSFISENSKNSKYERWYENGAPSKAWCFLLGVSPDLEILPSSEELIRA
ncbi:MAG: hypothetical protein COA79_18575, partial [Planctomycetota bacterium]